MTIFGVGKIWAPDLAKILILGLPKTWQKLMESIKICMFVQTLLQLIWNYKAGYLNLIGDVVKDGIVQTLTEQQSYT